jgi:hypothetical protein
MIESYTNGELPGATHRRRWLQSSSTALLSCALTSLLTHEASQAGSAQTPIIDPSAPFAPRTPHVPAKAKNVIVIFCAGAVSQLETWDFKPELVRWDDQPLPGGPAVTFQGPAGNLARPQYAFRQRGQTGKWVSDLLPHLAELTDDIAFVHSLTSKSNTHGPAENFLSTGFVLDGFPSLGSWVTYALGSECQDLPAYVAIPDPRGVPQNGSNNWGSGFLPAAFQGTVMSSKEPVRHLEAHGITQAANRASQRYLDFVNAQHLQKHGADPRFAARVASYQLAAKMQLSVPELNDLSSEPEHVIKMYGADNSKNPDKAAFARNCILARRLIERGVRFVQLFNGAYASAGKLNWDGHNAIKEQYDIHGEILDQPVAALIRDLKQRGLLADTLVVWCTEFGRMPFFQKGAKGRDHNPDGFTCWMTGAGVKAGVSHGMTDDFGQRAIHDIHPLYHFNATILHLLGLDFEKLSVEHNGIQRRLTNVEGKLIRAILA